MSTSIEERAISIHVPSAEIHPDTPNGDQHEEFVRPENSNDTTPMTVDSGYAAELMIPTADTSMGQATEKKKRERGKERTSNDRRKTDKAAKKVMTEEHRGN